MQNNNEHIKTSQNENIEQKDLNRQSLYKNQSQQLEMLSQIFIKILADNLVGLYLHGSRAMGYYNEDKSDIDLIAVIYRPMNKDVKKVLIEAIIQTEDSLLENEVEMSVILVSDLDKAIYPLPFELHYSKMHREGYLLDGKLCENAFDPDLSAHLSIIHERGKCLYGEPIESLHIAISKEHFLEAILNDLNYSNDDLCLQPEYVVLNLCRTLRYLEDGHHYSKLEGGNWTKGLYGQIYDEVIDYALSIYTGQPREVEPDKDTISFVAASLLKRIRTMIEEL